MKNYLLIAFSMLSFNTFAQDMSMTHFSWTMNDIASLGENKEDLFKKMDRDFMKVGQSICANRALMWLYEFKRDHKIDGSKIFLFYTDRKGQFSHRQWWYHVAPIINEKGEEWVMDAGFASISQPLPVDGWLKHFVGSNNCYEITPQDKDLIALMDEGHQFPEVTFRGKYDCYYAKAPAGAWFPSSVAMGLSGRDPSIGEINQKDVYYSCLEAVTNPIGRLLNSGKKKCKKFIEQ